MRKKTILVPLYVFCGGAVSLLLLSSVNLVVYEPHAPVVSGHLVQKREQDPLVKIRDTSMAAPSNHSEADLEAEETIITFPAGPSSGIGNSSDAGFSIQPRNLSLCPETPPRLVGTIKVRTEGPKLSEIENLYPDLEAGGHGYPSECLARHKVAIIIPYRDREEHLRIFLHNIHPFLAKQQLDYAIYIVEPEEGETFNRAKLMNIGFVEALKLYDWQCFVFHDVDLLPENDRILYSCPQQPRHLSVAVDKFNYKLPYATIFGGVTSLTRGQLEKTNGFSNEFWGWGGEDDNMSKRVLFANYKVSRFPSKIARYKMIKHNIDKTNPVNKCRYELLGKAKQRWKIDGLSNLNYTTVSVTLNHLFTHIKVRLHEKESREWLRSQGFSKHC